MVRNAKIVGKPYGTCWLLMTLFLPVTLTACSNQQVYGIGQAWQRNQCFTIDDPRERSRCLESAETPYEQYRRQLDAAP
jgi:hypothetical protein